MSEQTVVQKPVPVPDEATGPFFAGGATNSLMIRHCFDCDAFIQPGARICPMCLGEDLDWRTASGKATLHTFGIMHQRYHPGFEPEIPYNIAVVELEEGPRLFTNVVGCPNGDLKVGMKLAATFEQVSEGVYLPKFRPA